MNRFATRACSSRYLVLLYAALTVFALFADGLVHVDDASQDLGQEHICVICQVVHNVTPAGGTEALTEPQPTVSERAWLDPTELDTTDPHLTHRHSRAPPTHS